MYQYVLWKDHAVDPAHTYKVTENADGTITLTRVGKVIQQGTNLSAENFNRMEAGIFGAAGTALETAMMVRKAMDKAEALEGIVLTVDLTNSQKYPFNNSQKTVAFPSAAVRNNKDYTVIVEVQTVAGGFVGDIKISDKMLNGFKIQYSGSATSATLKLYIQGGI